MRKAPARSEAEGRISAVRDGALRPERRQLTVLFVDIVGSTALSESLDPEEFFAILREYRNLCDFSIQRFGGCIGESFGDGLLAYFGLPQAHEDDAERAVHAALSIVSSIESSEFATTMSRRRLNVRIAVNTGLVMVGQARAHPMAPAEIFGTTAHVAARLQSVAGPNEVIMGPSSYELVRGAFNCTYVGEQNLRGITDPVPAWRADSVRKSESRFARSQTAPLTPMVNRVRELAQLRDLWRASAQGAGSAVVISGDPGIGKSRLVQDFRSSIVTERMDTLYLQCSPLQINTPLSPEIDRIRRVAALRETDTAEQMVAKLRNLLSRARSDIGDAIRYYGALLSIPPCEGYEPADLSSVRERRRALETLLELTSALAQNAPLLIILEDAQWMDPTSAELLERLLVRVIGQPILFVITHRSDWSAHWHRHKNVRTIALPRLPLEECEQMAKVVAGDAAIPRSVLGKIVQRTDGVPLFIEEVTRAVIDFGAAGADGGGPRRSRSRPHDAPVPATIMDSLMERLDRLGDAKRIAQMAAIFGRSFAIEGLHSLTEIPRSRLMSMIGRLEARGLLRRASKTDSKLMFSHALIQEAAYESLLKEERRALHARAAFWLRSLPDHAGSHLAELGYHYSRAGLAAEAVECWLGAGKNALRHCANREAIASLREGLELIQSMPVSPQRCRNEIELQLNLALACTALAGWQFPAVERSYSRALELCRDFGTLRQKSIAFWGLTIANTVNCELAKAREFAEEFVALATGCGDDEAMLMAYTAAMIANFFLGRLPEAQSAAEQVFARYDARDHGGLAEIYQHDPKIVALVYSGHIEWILGRPQRARDCCAEARRYARELGHPFMNALALILGASDHLYDRDLKANLASVDEGIAVAREHGLQLYEYFGLLWAIEAVAARGPIPQSLEKLADLISHLLKEKCYLQAPLYKIWLAEEWARIGEVEKANALALAAEALMQRTGERWFEPEIYRIRARLLCQLPQPSRDDAKELLNRAVASARELNARGWELRAVIDLAQLLASDGKRAEAEKLLVDIRGKFDAADTSADLRCADEMQRALRRPAATLRRRNARVARQADQSAG